MIAWAAVGGGRMASALLRGAVAAGVCTAEQVAIAEPADDIRSKWDADGFITAASAAKLPAAQAYLLCIKPQDFIRASQDLNESQDLSSSSVTSIIAGIQTDQISQALNTKRIVRAMPNTAALIGESCTFAFSSAAASAEDIEKSSQLLTACGQLFWLDDENLIDAATAVSGCGPAYAYALMEAMIKQGTELGLDRTTLLAAVAQTVRGAGSMALMPGNEPEHLRKAVASKGGATEAALAVLEKEGFADAIRAAISRAHERAAQLAAEGKKKSSS